MNAALVAPLVTALTLSFVAVVRAGLPWIVLPKIGVLPRWGAIAVIVVAMDGLNWFVHLANHRVRLLWRFHELHHSQEDMNVLTVFRTHPLIHVSYLLALFLVVVLLANGAASITILVIYGGIVAFAHSNTRLSFGPLGRVFVSPNYHRIHHQLDGPQDVNLVSPSQSGIRSSIARCSRTKTTVRIDTGLPGRPLIVEQAGVDHGILQCSPLNWWRHSVHRATSRAPVHSVISLRRKRRGCRLRASTPGRVSVTSERLAHGDDDGWDALALRSSASGDHGEHPRRPFRRRLGSALRPHRVGLDLHLLRGWKALRLVQRSGHPWDLALYFSQAAHLHPGGLFAVLGGVIEFGGGIALALGLFSRLAGLALFGDMVMAMITVTWATGINLEDEPARLSGEPCARGSWRSSSRSLVLGDSVSMHSSSDASWDVGVAAGTVRCQVSVTEI